MESPKQTPQHIEVQDIPDAQEVAVHIGDAAVAHIGWTDELVHKGATGELPMTSLEKPRPQQDKLYDVAPSNDLRGGFSGGL